MTPSAVVAAKLGALVGGSLAVDVAAAGARSVTSVVEQAAATVAGLSVLGGGAWWLLGPRVREYLRTQQAAAATVTEVAANTDTLPAAAAELAELRGDVGALAVELGHVAGHLEAVDAQLAAHLVAVSAETRSTEQLIRRLAVEADERADL